MECLYFLSLFPLQFAKIRQFQNPFYIEIRLLSFYNDQKNKLLLSFFPVPVAKHYPTIPVFPCIFQQISFHIQFLKIASKHQ